MGRCHCTARETCAACSRLELHTYELQRANDRADEAELEETRREREERDRVHAERRAAENAQRAAEGLPSLDRLERASELRSARRSVFVWKWACLLVVLVGIGGLLAGKYIDGVLDSAHLAGWEFADGWSQERVDAWSQMRNLVTVSNFLTVPAAFFTGFFWLGNARARHEAEAELAKLA